MSALNNHIKQFYQHVFHYMLARLSRAQYIMLIAVVVGLVSGLLAVTMKVLVHYIQHWIQSNDIHQYGYLVFPVVGLLLTVFVIRHFFHGYIERGIAMVLRAIAIRSSFIPMSHTYLHVITSSITVGMGGSAGLEAPIVATGAAVGSNLSRISDMNYRDRTLLIACGAAAGIAAVFNAPVAGVIFAIEVLLVETVVSYFIPLIIASVVGALCSRIILKESILFNFRLKQNFDYHNVGFYIVLGILAGLVSLYYARIFKRVEMNFHYWKVNNYIKAFTGGLMLVVLYFFLEPLFGEGYSSITQLANNEAGTLVGHSFLPKSLDPDMALILFTGMVLLAKPVAAAITIGSGGNGGNFAPSLFTGSFLGYFFSRILNTTGFFHVPEGNFSLVGMAGVLSGVMYCPLTAIFLIAEITNGYELFIPLMIVSSISYFLVKHFEPFSMETKKLARDGQILTHKKEKNILTSLSIHDLLLDNYESISLDSTIKDVIELVKRNDRNIYAVHDGRGRFFGVIELNDIKQQLFQPEKYSRVSVRQLVKKPSAILSEHDTVQSVMDRFDESQNWYLPVLDKDRKFISFISKNRLFDKYREALMASGDLYDE